MYIIHRKRLSLQGEFRLDLAGIAPYILISAVTKMNILYSSIHYKYSLSTTVIQAPSILQKFLYSTVNLVTKKDGGGSTEHHHFNQVRIGSMQQVSKTEKTDQTG